MRPLLFLTGRTILNSFRRALQTPTRLLGVIFLVGWWFLIVSGNYRTTGTLNMNGMPATVDLPPMQVLYAVMFAVLLIVFAVRALSMFSVPGMNRSPDADVLFPTPISPRTVLMHRFALDYLISLFIPIVLLIFSGRRGAEGIQMLFRDLPDPGAAGLVGRSMLLSFLLLSLFAVSLSYAVGLYLNRDNPTARLAKRLTAYALAAGGVALAVAIALAIRSPEVWERLIAIPDSNASRIILYPVAAAADIAISPLYASWAEASIALAVLIVGSGALLSVALKQADYLYDMSARHAAATHTRQEASRTGDQSLLILQAAREGKLRPRTVGAIGRLRMLGRWGILWREAVLLPRMSFAMMIVFGIIIVFLGLLPAIDSDMRGQGLGVLAAIQVLLITSVSIALAYGGFLETLRRVDVQKPLPFSPAEMCAMEVLGKSLGPIVLSVIAAVMAFALTPGQWTLAVMLLAGLPSVAVAVVAVQLVVILLFPDVDDPTQRALRGLLQFLGAVLVLLPGIVILLILNIFLPLMVAVGVASVATLMAGWLCVLFAGPLYAAYNPSE